MDEDAGKGRLLAEKRAIAAAFQHHAQGPVVPHGTDLAERIFDEVELRGWGGWERATRQGVDQVCCRLYCSVSALGGNWMDLESHS